MVNGLWDGYIDSKFYWGDMVFDLSYEAVMGVPTADKTAEYNRKYGTNETRIVYAYDGAVNGVHICSFRGSEEKRNGWYGFVVY